MKNDFSALYLENQLCFPLYAASRLTTKIYSPFLNELDITYPQYLVLMVLWEKNDQTVNEIGNRLLLESNTLTPLLKRLEQKKLIRRKRSETDERSVLISLSPESETLKYKAVSIPQLILSSFTESTISVVEIQEFQKTLLKLVDILSRRANGN